MQVACAEQAIHDTRPDEMKHTSERVMRIVCAQGLGNYAQMTNGSTKFRHTS
jgi:hypothetical protein